MVDASPTDRAALKAWYEANFQPVGSKTADPSVNASGPGAAARPAKTRRHSQPVAAPPGEAIAAGAPSAAEREDRPSATAAERRAQLDRTRQQAHKKSLRWRLALFCFMVAGTIVAAIAIYVVIQQKFDGRIPYFESLE